MRPRAGAGMKLQVDAGALRLRLSEAELARLIADGVFEQAVDCPDGSSARCRLSLQDGLAEGRCEGHLMDLRVALPQTDFLAFAGARPRRDGYGFACGPLRVSVEVDVRDSHRRRTPPHAAGTAPV